jgi:hypothetical protein
MASHTGHNHPATPAARRACRASNGNPMVTRIESDATTVGDRVRPAKLEAPGVPFIRVPEDYPGTDREYRAAVMAGRTPKYLVSNADRRGRARTAGKTVQAAAKARATSTRPISRTGCPQAALHTPVNGGRCACGWSA